ncbi:uncharacterized protein LOC143192002 [Rhynchophorus ferrugineus]|uniref:uncharacterized protein LOC143192002 n=1 Tax=Rhynchophorus ferrugineus TaxID=354439 RepID=UPI003FCE2F11
MSAKLSSDFGLYKYKSQRKGVSRDWSWSILGVVIIGIFFLGTILIAVNIKLNVSRMTRTDNMTENPNMDDLKTDFNKRQLKFDWKLADSEYSPIVYKMLNKRPNIMPESLETKLINIAEEETDKNTQDPFANFKPSTPGEINLMAVENFRFSPSDWRTSKPPGAMQFSPSENLVGFGVEKPIPLILNIFTLNSNFPISNYFKTILNSMKTIDNDKITVHFKIIPDFTNN